MENHELKFKIIVLDRSYDTKCSDEDCQPMCDALNFDKYAKREIEAEVIESYVTLYPIPARDIISVNWGGWETDLSFELFDMLGNVVGKHTLLAKDNNATFELNLRSGSYSYRILSEGVIVKQGNLSIVK